MTIKTVILCGGLGTRLSEETQLRPKPMVEVGGKPILWHILKGYAAWGYHHFSLALGYKGEWIKDYFLNYHYRTSNISIELASGNAEIKSEQTEDWKIYLKDTGQDTMTGGRLGRLKRELEHESCFMLTYGDGVSDINIRQLLAFHKAHGKTVTVTAVRPPARFGTMVFSGDQVVEFAEKPQTGEGWINGGFFVMNSNVFDYIEGDDTVLEEEPLEALARDGELMAYRHEGFWQCMDTLRDKNSLEKQWRSGTPKWKTWND